MKRKTYEEVKSIVESQGSLLLSETYVNNRQLLKLVCKCGKPFEKNLDTMNRYKKYMCNTCSDKIARKNKSVPYNKIKSNIEKTGYKLETKESEYVNTEKKIKVTCKEGHSYEVAYNSFMSGKRCKKCYNENTRKRLTISYEEIYNFINSIGYFLHTPKEDYTDTKSRIEVSCDKGHRYSVRANSLRIGRRCKKCSDKEKGIKSRVPYEKMVEYVNQDGYKLLTSKEEYNGTHSYCLFQCNRSHNPYRSKMSEFLQGSRCPTCRESKGEKKIRKILNECNVSFFQQHKFEDCRFKQVLSFDFYLSEYNLCIEYDGIQHYKIIEAFGGFNGFVETKIRDTIKNEYCKNNNIGILRIPYFKFDEIENILLNKLKLSQDDTEVN